MAFPHLYISVEPPYELDSARFCVREVGTPPPLGQVQPPPIGRLASSPVDHHPYRHPSSPHQCRHRRCHRGGGGVGGGFAHIANCCRISQVHGGLMGGEVGRVLHHLHAHLLLPCGHGCRLGRLHLPRLQRRRGSPLLKYQPLDLCEK